MKKEAFLGVVEAEAKLGVQAKGKGPDAGKWTSSVDVRLVVRADGSLDVEVKEVGAEAPVASLHVAAS